MPTLHRMQTLAVAALFCATAAVSAAPVAPEVPRTRQARRGADRRRAAGAAAPAASREGLRIGLSDSGTKLVLPWFVTEPTDAVNQGKSAGDTAKALAQGF